MKQNSILQMAQKYSTLSIIGMDKNVGKTTVLNYILREARGKLTLGLTSIGRDGEEEDSVTATEKPRIYIKKGTLIATAKQCLFNGDITREILHTTNMHTAMGEVIIARAVSDGYVELGGPSINSFMIDICKELKLLGSNLVIIDGALSRKTSASPSITEATILSTGAALSRDMGIVVEKTAHTVKILSLRQEEDIQVVKACRDLLKQSRVGILFKDGSTKMLGVLTALEAAKEVVEELKKEVRCITIKGIVSDKFLEDIMKSTNEYKGVTFVAEDGTKVFLSKETLYKFEKQGGLLRVVDKINIICITANPNSPYGYSFDKDKFLDKLKNNINLPIFDVVGGD